MHAAFHVSLSVLAAGDLQYIQECMVKMEYWDRKIRFLYKKYAAICKK